MDDDRKKTLIVGLVIILVGVIYYVSNNTFSNWAFSRGVNPLLVILVYLFPAEPIYLLVIFLFWKAYGPKGLFAAIFLTIALDILSLPHSIMSVWPGQTTSIPNDPNLAPYEDFQIARWLALTLSHGVVTFWEEMVLYVVIPATLIIATVFLVDTEEEFEDLL